MKFTPSKDEVIRLMDCGRYDRIPLCASILADSITPIEALRKLRRISNSCFLLESASYDLHWGRYTFLGCNPSLHLKLQDGILDIGSMKIDCPDPQSYLRQILGSSRSFRYDGLPPFAGGLMGYFSFESFGISEPTAIKKDLAGASFRDLDLMLFDDLICFDHYAQKIILISNIRVKDGMVSYHSARRKIEQMKDLLENGEKYEDTKGRLQGDLKPLFEEKEFCEMVEKAKGHIREGDIFQIVLSNALKAPFEGTLLDTYRHLRTINPSPYMFYFHTDDLEAAGASPETLVRLDHGKVSTFPLAGTRPRGRSLQEDQDLEAELLQDAKELAEHDMLVDLGRNDLGRICTPGSVQVESLHQILRFSHVMHIGSTVSGEIDNNRDALDAIASALPAGTLSGAPKIRACQLIGELENNRRGLYGGAIGYLDFSGNMDMCIAIRIAWKKDGFVHVRSGAGIVADSDPKKEYQECLNKARSSLSALFASQEDDQ